MTDAFTGYAPRRRPKPPITWPAFAIVALAAAGGAIAYGQVYGPQFSSGFSSSALTAAFNAALIPTILGTLAFWCLLYFGYVRWKHEARGPAYFNGLLAIIFLCLFLSPFARHQVEVYKAGDVKGMEAAVAKVNARSLAEEQAARADLTKALDACAREIRLDPEVLLTAGDRHAARERITVAREAAKLYHAGYPERLAKARAAFVAAVGQADVSEEVAARKIATFDDSAKLQAHRSAKIQEWEQALFDEAEAGIAALSRSPWRPYGDRQLLFSSRADGEAFILAQREAGDLRLKLQSLTAGTADVVITDQPLVPAQHQRRGRPVADVYG
ncbi:hypothetical protein [Caulobacter endophyticus]|uniref:hypothetical protein n=1 Tax=Caulobacter endophyticus TaxID=2172652 RepID=UPI00240FB6B1|nr:hypothetical protein [Caulobacter endophyticus]MDG2528642.1 hypothetical protein [Caulobacter endophyticus]